MNKKKLMSLKKFTSGGGNKFRWRVGMSPTPTFTFSYPDAAIGEITYINKNEFSKKYLIVTFLTA